VWLQHEVYRIVRTEQKLARKPSGLRVDDVEIDSKNLRILYSLQNQLSPHNIT